MLKLPSKDISSLFCGALLLGLFGWFVQWSWLVFILIIAIGIWMIWKNRQNFKNQYTELINSAIRTGNCKQLNSIEVGSRVIISLFVYSVFLALSICLLVFLVFAYAALMLSVQPPKPLNWYSLSVIVILVISELLLILFVKLLRYGGRMWNELPAYILLRRLEWLKQVENKHFDKELTKFIKDLHFLVAYAPSRKEQRSLLYVQSYFSYFLNLSGLSNKTKRKIIENLSKTLQQNYLDLDSFLVKTDHMIAKECPLDYGARQTFLKNYYGYNKEYDLFNFCEAIMPKHLLLEYVKKAVAYIFEKPQALPIIFIIAFLLLTPLDKIMHTDFTKILLSMVGMFGK